MTWREVSLNQICGVDWGNTKLTKSSYVANGKFLAVSAAGADGLIDHFEHEADVPVLSAIGAQCGRMFFPGERFTAIKNTITLTPKVNIVDGKFLYYLFTHVELPQRGAGQPFISKGDIEAFRVVIPESLEEQRQIVEKLDSAFAEIDSLEANLKLSDDKANQLLQSLLSESFSSNGMTESPITELTIGEICEVGDGNHSSKYPTKNEMISAGVPFIRAQNIINGTVNDSDILFISDKKHESLKKGHLRTGDILITNRGEIGKLAIVPAEFNGSNLNSQIAWLRCNEGVNNSYLYYFLKSENARKYFDLGTSGSALQQLTISKLKQIRVPVVSILDQKAIVEKLDKVFAEIELLKSQIKQKKSQAVSLRQSLLSSAFTQEEAVA
jgi:restriction endonuclease S subunit